MFSLMVSKQTQDKVKLAKKYIEDKYQALLIQQRQQKENWNKIIKLMTKNKIPQAQKLCLEDKIKHQQNLKKRLMRQKDSLKNYQLYSLIGKGAFGEVCLAKNKKTNEIVAIKRMQKLKLIQKKQISSAYIQKQLMIKNNNSKYLVKLYSTFQDKNYVYLVMEYVSGGDLLHLLIEKDIFTQQQTKFYIAQLILAIQQIHNKNFIHRDIKPDNILIDKYGHIKISDFGLSKYMIQEAQTKQKSYLQRNSVNKKSTKNYKSFKKQHQCLQKIHMIRQRVARTYSKVGTPDYISPQVLTSQQYDYSIDIWSVGVIMFQCLFGYPPFSDQDPKQVCQKVVNWIHYLQFPTDIQVSFQAKLLILGMVNERQKRLNIQQIKIHPFFNGINWQRIGQYKPPMIPVIQNQLDTRNFQKYTEQINWVQSNQNLQQDFQQQKQHPIGQINQHGLNCKKRSRSVDYLFAGFQYNNVSLQPFKAIQNDIIKYEKIQQRKQKVKQISKQNKNPQTMKKSYKRFHTQEQNNQKNFMNQKNTIKALKKNGSQKYIIKSPFAIKKINSQFNQTTNSYLQNSKFQNNLTWNKQIKQASIKKSSQFNSNRKILTCSKNVSKKAI